MIEKKQELSNEQGYKKYSYFKISKALESLLKKEYILYNTKTFDKHEELEALYKKNFYDKYDKSANSMVYEKYINNESFKNKALFIYAIIDFDKYSNFVKNNKEIKNPNDYTLEYSILDSKDVKINIYNLNILDISFVF